MATRPKTGGRKKGTKNKATVVREVRAAMGVKGFLDAGVLPLDVMLRRMRGDETISSDQFQAAIAAAPYVHARLAPVLPPSSPEDDSEKAQRLHRMLREMKETVGSGGSG